MAYSIDFLSKNGKILDMKQEALLDADKEIKGLLTREEAKEISDIVLVFRYNHSESKRIAKKFPVTDDNFQGRLASLGTEVFIYLREVQLGMLFSESGKEAMEHGLTNMEPKDLIYKPEPDIEIEDIKIEAFWRD